MFTRSGSHARLTWFSGEEPDVVGETTVRTQEGPKADDWTSIGLAPVKSKDPLIWRAGMRVLKAELSIPRSAAVAINKGELLGRARIAPADHRLSATGVRSILSVNKGLVMPIWADIPASGYEVDHLALRRLDVSPDGQTRTVLELEDEIGDNIARHVWDSGVVALAVIADMCSKIPRSGSTAPMPLLRDLLLQEGKLHILEIGCGIGTVGIGVAALLQACADDRPLEATILLTDLPDAEERAVANISRFQEAAVGRRSGTGTQLEYGNLDWEDGRRGVFPPKVDSVSWDLVVLSDCTYNVDTLPALVQTLSALKRSSGDRGTGHSADSSLRILVATKERHSSERAFFDLMSTAGWTVSESLVLPLPVLAAPSESIELYLFDGGLAALDLGQT